MLLRMEHLLHDLLDHVIFFLDESLLTLQLCLQLLILLQLLIQHFLEVDLLFIKSFFISVFQTVWNIGSLVEVLL